MPAGSGQWADVTNGHAHLVSPSKFLFWVGNRRQSPANFRGSGTQKGAENENVSEIALPPLGTRRGIRVEMLRAAIS